MVFVPIRGMELEPVQSLAVELDLTPIALCVCGFIESPPRVAGRAVDQKVGAVRSNWGNSMRALIAFHLLTSLRKPLSMA